MDYNTDPQDSDNTDKNLFYEAPAFIKNSDSPIFHAFFGRRGGNSKGVYHALNCAHSSDDTPDSVNQNISRIAKEISLPPENILTLRQIHGTDCIKVKDIWTPETRPEADALITDKPGIALGILTADCAPILLWGKTQQGTPVIAAAHAGWKGALNGILESTLTQMDNYGVQKDTIRACIGPCIGQYSYEVSNDFMETILKESDDNERFFQMSRKTEHFMFDLAGYCAFKLSLNGIKNIIIKDLDTYFNENDFFSYRRATHRGEKDYGRQISLIYIKP